MNMLRRGRRIGTPVILSASSFIHACSPRSPLSLLSTPPPPPPSRSFSTYLPSSHSTISSSALSSSVHPFNKRKHLFLPSSSSSPSSFLSTSTSSSPLPPPSPNDLYIITRFLPSDSVPLYTRYMSSHFRLISGLLLVGTAFWLSMGAVCLYDDQLIPLEIATIGIGAMGISCLLHSVHVGRVVGMISQPLMDKRVVNIHTYTLTGALRKRTFPLRDVNNSLNRSIALRPSAKDRYWILLLKDSTGNHLVGKEKDNGAVYDLHAFQKIIGTDVGTVKLLRKYP